MQVLRHPVFILAIAFTLRGMVVISGTVHTGRAMLTDSEGYCNLASHIYHDGVFSQENSLTPDPIRTPLYPLLILICGQHIGVLLWVQLIAGMATVWLSMRAARILTQNSNLAVCITGWLMALDIPSIIFTGLVATENIFTLLLTSGVYFLLRYLYSNRTSVLIYSSVCIGLAMLCRPIALFLPVFLSAGFIIVMRKQFSLKKVLVFLIPVYTLCGMWVVRNYQTFGSLFYTRIGTFNLAWFQASMIRAQVKTISIHDARWEIFSEAAQGMKQLPVRDPVTFYNNLGRVSRNEIISHPWPAIQNAVMAEMNLFFRPSMGYTAHVLGLADLRQSLGLEEIHYNTWMYVAWYWQWLCMLVIYIGIASGILFRKKWVRPLGYGILLLFIFYFMLPGTGPEMEARFRIPLMPVLSMMAACGYLAIQAYRNQRRLLSAKA